jgi:hypothetical protein
MTRIKILFFIAGLIGLVIIAYFVRIRSHKSIVEAAKKIASSKHELELLTNELDSLWPENQATTSIILQIHDKRDYLRANCYNHDSLVLERKIPRADYINRITSNDIITVYKYTKEYLLLRRFMKGRGGEEFSLIFFRPNQSSQKDAIDFIQSNFKHVNSAEMVSEIAFLFSQTGN